MKQLMMLCLVVCLCAFATTVHATTYYVDDDAANALPTRNYRAPYIVPDFQQGASR